MSLGLRKRKIETTLPPLTQSSQILFDFLHKNSNSFVDFQKFENLLTRFCLPKGKQYTTQEQNPLNCLIEFCCYGLLNGAIDLVPRRKDIGIESTFFSPNNETKNSNLTKSLNNQKKSLNNSQTKSLNNSQTKSLNNEVIFFNGKTNNTTQKNLINLEESFEITKENSQTNIDKKKEKKTNHKQKDNFETQEESPEKGLSKEELKEQKKREIQEKRIREQEKRKILFEKQKQKELSSEISETSKKQKQKELSSEISETSKKQKQKELSFEISERSKKQDKNHFDKRKTETTTKINLSDKMVDDELLLFNPLMKYIYYQKLHKIQLYLELGAEVNFQNATGLTPLMLACKKTENLEIVQLLLEYKADPLLSDKEGNTALFLACKARSFKIAKWLIEHSKIDLNFTNCHGKTPLIEAVRSKSLENVSFFMSKGALLYPQNPSAGNAFLCACFDGSKDIVDFFLKNGADINRPDSAGRTPLASCISANRYQIGKYLIKKGADLNLPSTQRNETPLLISISSNHYKMCKLLLENNAKINLQDSRNYSPLMKACVNPNLIFILKLLLNYNPILDITSKEGKTALFLACENCCWKNIILLLEFGFNFYNSLFAKKEIKKCIDFIDSTFISSEEEIKRGIGFQMKEILTNIEKFSQKEKREKNTILFLCLRKDPFHYFSTNNMPDNIFRKILNYSYLFL